MTQKDCVLIFVYAANCRPIFMRSPGAMSLKFHHPLSGSRTRELGASTRGQSSAASLSRVVAILKDSRSP
eukprot:6201900-Pleurochrysis_carterae.AAC.1